MKIRCWGGPKHNNLVSTTDQCIVMYRTGKWVSPPHFQNSSIPTVQTGKYWGTPETDKQGNPIYAWTGWK